MIYVYDYSCILYKWLFSCGGNIHYFHILDIYAKFTHTGLVLRFNDNVDLKKTRTRDKLESNSMYGTST